MHIHTPSQTKVKAFLKRLLFGTNVRCVECHSYRVVTYAQRYRCRDCLARFSLISSTWLTGTKLSLTRIWQLLWCYLKAIPVKQTQELTSLSENTVRHWYDRCRDQLLRIDSKLSGRIQVDEVYLGGWGGRAVIAGKSIDTKEIRFVICTSDHVTPLEMYQFFERYIIPHSYVYTDGSPLYPRICRQFKCFHHQDIHAEFQFTFTSEIEGLFGNLRTFVRRMYHHVTPQKLPEYLIEFQYRFSRKIQMSSVQQFLLYTFSDVTTR